MVTFSVSGNFVDIPNRDIYPATVTVKDGKIASILKADKADAAADNYILPGFIDSHVHIESSMLVPSEFGRLAVVHGTVATISDPHEIANVCGVEGVQYMIDNGKTIPFKFHFGAPSCVPATVFETAGAEVNAAQVRELLASDDIFYLSEMMNFPGVLHSDPVVMEKIKAAHEAGKPVDGHAPGLRGEQAAQYIAAGISTDHECFTKEEALDKLHAGMKILIREGSAAKNFEALIDLLNDYPDMIMFCSDDKHPDSLVEGHINQLCARAVTKGIDIFNILKAACINPVEHYKMKVGLLQRGDAADFIVVKDLVNFEVLKTYIDGVLVAEKGKSGVQSRESLVGSQESGKTLLASVNETTQTSSEKQAAKIINQFSCNPKNSTDFEVAYKNEPSLQVIEALDGQLITPKFTWQPVVQNGWIVPDVDNDILKIAVVNRYKEAPVAKAFIKNIGLKKGAIASSVAHDSHNIVVVGVDDESIAQAVNLIIEHKGGVSIVNDKTTMIVPLPVAGLMSIEDGYKVAKQYSLIDQAAKEAGSTLTSPYMTLSFMALLVIPHLKLSDLGLFDGDKFEFI